MNNNKNTGKRHWNRSQVTIRLTTARKEQLALLTTREGVSGGPTAVINRAIDLALIRSESPMSELIDLLESRLTQTESERTKQAAAMSRIVVELKLAVEQLSEALRTVAEDS